MTSTTPKTLADVQVGDEVAYVTDNHVSIVKVVKRTPAQIAIHGGFRRFDLEGREIGGARRYVLLYLPTRELRRLAKEQIEKRKAQEEAARAHAAKVAAIEATPEMQAVDIIASAFNDDFVSLEQRYALAQRIGLSKLQDFAEAIRKAQETT